MKHLSFDFWNTIANPNSEYAKARTAFLAKEFGVDEPTAKATYTAVKGKIDSRAEQSGEDFGRTVNLTDLCDAFGRPADDTFIDHLGQMMDQLFAENPASVDPLLIEQFHRAREKNITLSITSNTNFITGRVLCATVLNAIPFDFLLFSDEIGFAKPHPEIFARVAKQARQCNSAVVTNADIYHVGDHRICDGEGAKKAGMNFAYTADASDTAKVLKHLLDHRL